jgi:hypothetical protein
MSRVTLVAALVLLAQACTLGHPTASAPPPIGDACLVGTWTLDQDVNTTGYTFNNVQIEVSGLEGATMTFTSDGAGVEDFTRSQSLTGTTADGHQLSITLRGKWPFHIHADGHKYVETGPKTPLPTSATLDGLAVDYSSYYSPASGTYTCSKRNLVMVDPQVQTDTFSKG